MVARTLQEVIEADFADATKDAMESQERKGTPKADEISATHPEEKDASAESKAPPAGAKEDETDGTG